MEKLDSTYWNKRYDQGETGWDAGAATPPITQYVDQLTDRNIRILIPGCGNAHEARYLLEKGFRNVTVIDIAPSLTEALKKELSNWNGKELTILTGDFFEMEGYFDLILEQTFFCALNPSMREAYVTAMHERLSPGGKLVGVLFNRIFEGGPPFGGTVEEYKKLFYTTFKKGSMEPCYNSINPRKNAELFIQFEK